MSKSMPAVEAQLTAKISSWYPLLESPLGMFDSCYKLWQIFWFTTV